MKRLSIAIVGSGVSGLCAAWLLSREHHVTLFEADARLGGHANTVDVETAGGERLAIDTGFIVANSGCYHNLLALFEALGVDTAPTQMSFAVSLGDGAYEYAGSARGLVGQPRNLLRVAHWRMVRDMLRFLREAQSLVVARDDTSTSLGAWLQERGYSAEFIERHIRPMAAAIWSTPSGEVLAFPAAAFARFFANHGLLKLRNRPQWLTVLGGSRTYVERVRAAIESGHAGQGVVGNVHVSSAVRQIVRTNGNIHLRLDDGTNTVFDRVIIATHPDQALGMLQAPSDAEQQLLSSFRYAKNDAFLHQDAGLMPRRRRLWSSWNFIGNATDEGLSVSYHMNALQPLLTAEDFFVTLNPVRPVQTGLLHGRWRYEHPIFDARAMDAQRRFGVIQGVKQTYFAGAYLGYGFHECGAQAGFAAAEALVRNEASVRAGDGQRAFSRPWSLEAPNDRLAYLNQQPRDPALVARCVEAVQ